MMTELDRISNLPRHVMDQILSHLSIRDAVRTCALSSKWRYKWARIPSLVFDNQCFSVYCEDKTLINSKLVKLVDHVLLLHKGPIRNFKLSHQDLICSSDLDRWILYISRKPIKEFILDIWNGESYKLPSCLFYCQELIHLELFNCLLKPPSKFKGFRNLKSLDLQCITLAQDVFQNLISSCTLLDWLKVKDLDGVAHLAIDAPNLKFLSVEGDFDDVSFKNTFHLASVSIMLKVSVNNDENRDHGSSSKLLRFFAHLPHIQRLEVENYSVKYLARGDIPSRLLSPCVDLNYLSIHINFNDPKENSAALCLLRSSPNLQELETLTRQGEHTCEETVTDPWKDDHWISLFPHLRLVTIAGITGDVRHELDFIDFILSNSPALERMTVKLASIKRGWEFVKKLLRLRRASVRAEIIFLDP